MTETKKILNIALPAMAENLLQMLMGVVDSYQKYSDNYATIEPQTI